MGYKDHNEIPKYLITANVLILPNTAKTDISLKHTSPIKLFEYMASKVPVIASDICSIKQFVNSNHVTFFKADNAKDLADKIIFILKNSKNIINKTKKAYNLIKNNTWEKRCMQLVKNFI